MYTASVAVNGPTAPWENYTFDQRLSMLMRGHPRAAYYYPVPDTSTFRYRAYNMAQAMCVNAGRNAPSAGWFCERDLSYMGRVLDACDVLILCRASLYDSKIAGLAAQARARGRTILFDVDDLVFDPAFIHIIMDLFAVDTRLNTEWDKWFGYVGRIGATFRLCDGSLVTNDRLAERAATWSGKPSRVVHNFLNAEQQLISDGLWAAKDKLNWSRDDRLHLGYFSGSPSHTLDFALVAPAIAALMDEDRSIWLRVIGFFDLPSDLDRHRSRVEHMPLMDFVSLQREIGAVEINLVPLLNNIFTNCKSELKWFEAAIAGALTLASPIHSYRQVIKPPGNGWLVESAMWHDVLRDIVQNFETYRADVAPRARIEARENFGWDRQAQAIEAAVFADW